MKNKDLIKIQKAMYDYMKKKAYAYEESHTRDLKSYHNNQNKLAKRRLYDSNLTEIMRSIKSSRSIYVGDFHTFDQSGRNILRIFRQLLKLRKKLILGVEFVDHKHQVYIEQYIKGIISELEFLESIEYHESWRFPWVHYKFFFELAKEYDFKIIALNTSGTLKERDHFAAQIICDHLRTFEDHLFVTFFGELHIFPNKLPQIVEKKYRSTLKQTIIHQNLDEVYWKAITKESKRRFFKFNKSEFILQTSPPWIKYESMIYWYEHLSDDPEFDIHEYVFESGLKSFDSNIDENFFNLSQHLNKIFNLPLKPEEIENFNLYDHTRLAFILSKIKKIKNKELNNFYNNLILHGKSFKIPFSYTYYCPSYSLNRIASLSGRHLYHLVQTKKNKDYDDLITGNIEEKFYHYFFMYYFSYLCTKVINPYRKCDMYQDFIETIDKTRNKTKKKYTELAVEIIETPEIVKINLGKNDLRIVNSAAKACAYFLADVSFEKFRNQKNKNLPKITSLFFNENINQNLFSKVFKLTFGKNDFKNYKKHLF